MAGYTMVIPATQQDEVGGSQVPGQREQLRPCLKF